MYIAFGILVILVAILLALVVIIQNPKGGMLSSSIGSMGNQILGASRSTDAIEKITWYLAGGLMILSIASIFVLPDSKTAVNGETTEGSAIQKAINEKKGSTTLPSVPAMTPPQGQTQQAPAQGSAPAQQTNAPAQTPPTQGK